MEATKANLERLKEIHPLEWDRLPDISLYMDQLVSYISRQLSVVSEDEALTAAMVNNYIKAGLMPKASEKRYSREHIAYLTAICIMKRVMQTKEMGVLLPAMGMAENTEAVYAELCAELTSGIDRALEKIPEDMSDEALADAAFRLSVSAYCDQLIARLIIDHLAKKDGAQ